jgi:hypothetical protein
MSDTPSNESEETNASSPPPLPPQPPKGVRFATPQQEQAIAALRRFIGNLLRFVAALPRLMVAHFWWFIGGATVIKILSYFAAPESNATAGYHVTHLLLGFVGFGAILALIAFILSKCMKTRPNVFRIAFAILFSLACLLEVPAAIMRRKAISAVEHLSKSYAAFEALMRYEDNPIVGTRLNIYTMQNEEYRKPVYGDRDKYFNLSYCYANGYDGYPKDVGKAVQLCQMAATAGNYDAQSLLRKAGFSWQKRKSRY